MELWVGVVADFQQFYSLELTPELLAARPASWLRYRLRGLLDMPSRVAQNLNNKAGGDSRGS